MVRIFFFLALLWAAPAVALGRDWQQLVSNPGTSTVWLVGKCGPRIRLATINSQSSLEQLAHALDYPRVGNWVPGMRVPEKSRITDTGMWRLYTTIRTTCPTAREAGLSYLYPASGGGLEARALHLVSVDAFAAAAEQRLHRQPPGSSEQAGSPSSAIVALARLYRDDRVFWRNSFASTVGEGDLPDDMDSYVKKATSDAGSSNRATAVHGASRMVALAAASGAETLTQSALALAQQVQQRHSLPPAPDADPDTLAFYCKAVGLARMANLLSDDLFEENLRMFAAAQGGCAPQARLTLGLRLVERGDIAGAVPLLQQDRSDVGRFTLASLMVTGRIPGGRQQAMELFTTSEYEPAALNAAILNLRDGLRTTSYNRYSAIRALERLRNSPNTAIAYAANTAWSSYATGTEKFDSEYPWMRTFIAIAGAVNALCGPSGCSTGSASGSGGTPSATQVQQDFWAKRERERSYQRMGDALSGPSAWAGLQ